MLCLVTFREGMVKDGDEMLEWVMDSVGRVFEDGFAGEVWGLPEREA